MSPLKCPMDSCTYETTDLSSEEFMFKMLYGHCISIHDIDLNGSNNQNQERGEKVKKPIINTGCTLEDWSFFIAEWSDFKDLSKPSKNDISRILLQCCETDLRKTLHRTHGSLGAKPEDFVLNAIKQQAVQIENIVVSRVSLLEMKQDRDASSSYFFIKLFFHFHPSVLR